MKKSFYLVLSALIITCCNVKNETDSVCDGCKQPGIKLQNEFLKIRVVDNSTRYVQIIDTCTHGLNGIASLIDKKQHKNIFTVYGMNLENVRVYPEPVNFNTWTENENFVLSRANDSSVIMSLRREDGLINFDVQFTLSGHYIDQTFTVWPGKDLDSLSFFMASKMNQPQNTSLFMRKPASVDPAQPWIEVTSAGHGGQSEIFERPFNPIGMDWFDYLRDNPVRRQAIVQSPESLKSTKEAGFKHYKEKKMDHFYYGFIDNYVYLQIFKEPEFIMWMSASGGIILRMPAWDYEVKTGIQKKGEKKSFHTRLVYKPFVSFDDIMLEVDKFLKE
jgi:hypothetical protein